MADEPQDKNSSSDEDTNDCKFTYTKTSQYDKNAPKLFITFRYGESNEASHSRQIKVEFAKQGNADGKFF